MKRIFTFRQQLLAFCLIFLSASALAGDLSVVGEIRPLSPGLAAVAIDTSVGEMGRISAEPGESFALRLTLADAELDAPLRVSAGMGGVIDGKRGPLVRKRLDNPQVDLTFTVGKSPGRYLLELRNGGESQFLEFWVGEQPPQGKPGPERTFSAPASLK